MIFLKKKIGGEPPIFFSYNSKTFIEKNVDENIYFFSSGRNAILEIIKKENIADIFIPKYYCYPVYISIKSLENIVVHNYSSRKELIQKVNNVNKFKKKIIIFLVFNGLQHSLNEYLNLEEFRDQSVVKIVDAAMTASLSVKKFSYDYLVTSPRKFYRNPIGGIVFTKNKFDFKKNFKKNPYNNFKYLVSKILSRIFLGSRISLLENYGLKINNFAENNVPENLDIFNYYFLKNIKIYDLSKSRINQYNTYFELLDPIKRYFFYDSPASNNDCPFGFILKIENKKDIINFLSKRRIYVSTLWKLPSKLKNEVSEKDIISFNNLIVLPIGPQYDLNQIKEVCNHLLKFLCL